MIQATYHFPRGFLWGTATASHQVEGNNTNNQWWAWEQTPGHILQDHKSGLACDWWGGRWREDFDRAAEAGQNAHRLSIEWSRVQPTPDRWDEDAIDRYREMMQGLRSRNMTAMVTLHHFTDPLWLVEQGGWENPAVVPLFEKYVRKIVEALKGYASLWITINEPNVFSVNSYILGDFPPGKKNLSLGLKVMEHLAQAHVAAYHAIHEIQPTARVGIAAHYIGFEPAKSWSPFDRALTGIFSSLFNDFFPRAFATGVMRLPTGRKTLSKGKGTQDFVGLNYYTKQLLAFAPLRPKDLFFHRYFRPRAEMSDAGFLANEPEGMFESLKWAKGFNVPVIVTENGVPDADDDLRPRYLLQHIHQVWRAANFNWPVKGYFVWTLVDNFEWERGWTQRFGLWELDVETQGRRRRPSVDLYAEICRENGISSGTVAKYAPEILEKIFPDIGETAAG